MKPKLFLMIVLLASLFINTLATSNAEANEIKVKVNGQYVNFPHHKPFISNNIVFASLNPLCKPLKFTYTWTENYNTVVIENDYRQINFTIGQIDAIVNYEQITMPAPARIEDNEIVIPLVFICERLGAETKWNAENQTLEIEYRPSKTEMVNKVNIYNSVSEKYGNYQREWALGIGAVLKKVNNWNLDVLGGVHFLNEDFIQSNKEGMAKAWRIESREDALRVIRSLKTRGQRSEYEEYVGLVSSLTEQEYQKLLTFYSAEEEFVRKSKFAKEYHQKLGEKSLVGWDYCRLAEVIEKSYVLGYITADEAWTELMAAARVVGETFSSWEDMGRNYLLGRFFWCGENDLEREEAFQWLLNDPQSPWVQHEWGIYLGESPSEYDYDKKVVIINAGETGVHINGKLHQLQSAPRLVGEEILVPVHLMQQAFECTVNWQKGDENAVIKFGELEIKFDFDEKPVYINGQRYYPAVPASMIEKQAYIPFRFTAEHLGITIHDYSKPQKIMAVMNIYKNHSLKFILPPGFAVLGMDFKYISFTTDNTSFYINEVPKYGYWNEKFFKEFLRLDLKSIKTHGLFNSKSMSTETRPHEAVTTIKEDEHQCIKVWDGDISSFIGNYRHA